jgi:hypothetical protein
VTSQLDDFAKLNTKIIVVVQAKPEVLKTFLDRNPQKVRFVSDPTREAYKQFQLKRNSLISFLRLWEIWGYLKIIGRGFKPTLPYKGEDYQQLGGDFILNQKGDVLSEARPTGATDRPSAEELLQVIRQLLTKPDS